MVNQKQITVFITIALLWAYIFLIAAAIISNKNPSSSLVSILHIVGCASPLLATLYYLAKTGGWKEYFGRLIDFSHFSWVVWLIILAPVIFSLLGSLIANGRVKLDSEFAAAGVAYAVILLFFGPLPEELGWRGVLFDGLAKGSFVKAQITTAAIWFIWHLPLFFIRGSYQNGLGFLTTGFCLWGIALVLQSIIMGYLYMMSGRSITSAILFHYLVNLSGEAIAKNTSSEIVVLVFYSVLAIVLIAVSSISRGTNIANG
jgi:membrane protease YdiL (CAAX protease family)